MIPPSRRPSTKAPRVSDGFDLPCTCGVSDWLLLKTLEPDEEGRRRAYGCGACGQRLDTREVVGSPITAQAPAMTGIVFSPDNPCPACGDPRLERKVYRAYDALIARQYDCATCGASWRTAEVVVGGPRAPLPRKARRTAHKAALGGIKK